MLFGYNKSFRITIIFHHSHLQTEKSIRSVQMPSKMVSDIEWNSGTFWVLQQKICVIVRKRISKLFLTFSSELILGNGSNFHVIIWVEPLFKGVVWLKMLFSLEITVVLFSFTQWQQDLKSGRRSTLQTVMPWGNQELLHFSVCEATGIPNSHKALRCLRLFRSQSFFILIKIHAYCLIRNSLSTILCMRNPSYSSKSHLHTAPFTKTDF